MSTIVFHELESSDGSTFYNVMCEDELLCLVLHSSDDGKWFGVDESGPFDKDQYRYDLFDRIKIRFSIAS